MTAAAYGVKSRLFGRAFAKRRTFLIDPEGRIARHYEDVDPKTHSRQLLADLETLTADD
jgi:peroxiredoxin Q/BCP